MFFTGFAATRITKRLHLPNVTAYILAGVLLGSFCLDLVPRTVIDGMEFLSDIALAFIAFSSGESFKLSVKAEQRKGNRHNHVRGTSCGDTHILRFVYRASS